MCFLCHLIAWTTDPGTIKKNTEKTVGGNVCDKCNLDRLQVRLPNDTDIQGRPITLNYNHHCNKGCGHCIFMKEHHCVFLSKCAGYRNINCFFLFTVYLFLTCLQTLYLIICGYYQNDYRYGVTSLFQAVTNKFNLFSYFEVA